jgi:GNAT superfamily N-acetyltransferase
MTEDRPTNAEIYALMPISAHYRWRELPLRDSLLDELHFERGRLGDYESLARFHYKSGRPSPAKAVFRIRRHAPTVVGRYVRRGEQDQIIGVLVRSLPHLSCQMRDVATHGRYQGLKRRDAAAMLNREVRTISRVVIDPQWRGLGLAVKLVRFALDQPHDSDSPGATAPLFTEALAAMGHVSPFFERAGMTRYDRPARPEHTRLLDALRHLSIEPHLLAATGLVNQRITRPDDVSFLVGELRTWLRARRRSVQTSIEQLPLEALLRAARDELLAQPVYYLFQHAAFQQAASSDCLSTNQTIYPENPL